jgi:probable phosphoglycerate mutase
MDMNHLSETVASPYEIFGLRHGYSIPQGTASEGTDHPGIIVSHPQRGVQLIYGLAEPGKVEVAHSAHRAVEEGLLDDDILIISSDFSRAIQSAKIFHEILKPSEPIVFTSLLRERNFGELEGTTSLNYPLVWTEDEKSADHRIYGVESVNQVLSRTTSLIRGILDVGLVKQKKILLVSHGDSMQIMETGFRKVDPRRHRSLEHLRNAEIRRYDQLLQSGA